MKIQRKSSENSLGFDEDLRDFGGLGFWRKREERGSAEKWEERERKGFKIDGLLADSRRTVDRSGRPKNPESSDRLSGRPHGAAEITRELWQRNGRPHGSAGYREEWNNLFFQARSVDRNSEAGRPALPKICQQPNTKKILKHFNK